VAKTAKTATLIQIKHQPAICVMLIHEAWRKKMPADSILISIGVCVMFLSFAFAIAWADHTTSQWIRGKVDAKQRSTPAQPNRKAA
jgi:hypothetical protein